MADSEDLLLEIKNDIGHVKEKTEEILKLSKDLKVPLGLQKLLRDSFRCTICQVEPMRPPVILSKCCKSLLGCEECVNTYYSGPCQML
jgi:hypothetical protein